jgi:hypothetical protein
VTTTPAKHAPRALKTRTTSPSSIPRIRESDVELVAYLIAHHPVDANPAGLGERL